MLRIQLGRCADPNWNGGVEPPPLHSKDAATTRPGRDPRLSGVDFRGAGSTLFMSASIMNAFRFQRLLLPGIVLLALAGFTPPASAQNGVPRPDHVVVVIEANFL